MTLHSPLACISLFLLSALSLPGQDASPPLPERTALAVQVLSRMDKSQIEQNERLRETLAKVLEQTRGRPEFVQLVKQFGLTNQNEALLDMVAAHPDAAQGVDAVRLLLATDAGTLALGRSLREPDAARSVPMAEAMGNAVDQRTLPLLQPLITSTNANLEVRKAGVRALARTREGARALITSAANDLLPADLKFTATASLASIRWPELRDEAAAVLPPPQGQNAEPLPPLRDLLKQQGNPERGAEVFARDTSQCAQCHKIGDRGTEVGPNLSEIGGKLAKDALYESILDPSAGISFNYEAWEISLKSGDEAFGILVSETADELVIRDSRGLVTRYPKTSIETRRQMTLSMMPSGLQLTMSTQDLIDLVEFLASLKK